MMSSCDLLYATTFADVVRGWPNAPVASVVRYLDSNRERATRALSSMEDPLMILTVIEAVYDDEGNLIDVRPREGGAEWARTRIADPETIVRERNNLRRVVEFFDCIMELVELNNIVSRGKFSKAERFIARRSRRWPRSSPSP